MGQNSSSLRGASRRELSQEQEHIRDTSTSSPSTSTSEIRESTRTNRRVTLRKSILSLVKPNPKSSGDSSNQEGKRKSWRRSRRWSRAPVPPSALEVVSSEPEPASATSATILPTTSITSPKEGDAGFLAPALIETQQPSSSPVAEPLGSISGEASPSSSHMQHDAISVPQSPEQDQSNSGLQPEKPPSALSPVSLPSQSPSTDPGLSSIPDHEDESLGITSPPESSLSQTSNTEPSLTPSVPPPPTNPASTHPETVEQPVSSTHPASQPEQETQVPSQPSSSSTPPSSTSNTASPPNNRPFPPPGTLVVVQGVVHTTDVPRPTSASGEPSLLPGSLDPRHHNHIEPEPSRLSSRLSDSGLGSIIRRRSVSSVAPRPRSEASTSRNRLSALFNQGSRPSSGSQASSAADLALDASSVAPEDMSSSSPVPVAESASSSPSSSSRTGDTSSTSEATTAVTEESGSSVPQNDSNTGSPPSPPSSGIISSSSIDVLGTLLSVAAAATAASLLTGSSEPILSPPHLPRPAPFGGLTLGRQGEEHNHHINAIGRADRMRQAWGSIRERLGLRPNPTPSSLVSPQASNTEESTTGAGVRGLNEDVPLLADVDGRVSEENSTQSLAQPSRSPTSPPRPPAVEARERMLSDMARAFQLGLGLNAPIATGVPASGNDNELGVEGSLSGGGASDPLGIGLGLRGDMPPEGSFERFLVDLQTDLRVALGGSGSSLNNQNQPEEREPEPEDDEREGGQREGRENDTTVDELFRLIAEAEAEVRQRQRMIAQRQAALRALVAGAGIPETLMDRGINATSPSVNAQAASESIAASAASDPAPTPAPAPSRIARVEDAEDPDDDMPPLLSVSDSDSGSEQSSDEEDEGAATQQQQQQRTQAALARLSSMVNPAAAATSTPSPSSAAMNSINELLNRRRALGIGRRPPVPQPAPPPPASEPELEPEEDTEMPALEPIESAPISTAPRNIASSSALPAPTSTSTSTAAPEPPSASTSPNPTNGSPAHRPIGSRTAVDDATGRINWWRLYRFPPIAAPPPRNGGTTAPRGNDATSPAAASIMSQLQQPPASQPGMSSVASPASPTSSAPAGDSSSSSSPQAPLPSQVQSPTQPSTAPNTVVPVIVVGLQSVNLPLFGSVGGANPTTEPTAPTPASAGGTEHEEHEEERESEEQDGADGDNRRRWHSRAAEALRNLRPGRRQTPRPGLLPDMLDGPGSRTFLIYVIGGYYPPDHHMVTGDPETLDSFEALLDLADLLGVKPATASKEEIERSGLEIIKSTQLKQYEAEGKISYNCTDRCLICLDDYEAEDDVRVLTCKHAFHMGCVDKWLQEGKNNCPACRGTGVPAGSS